MQNMIIDIMNQFGYFGIILLIAIENIFPPIPSEVILTFGGFMTTYSNLSPLGVIVSATLGSTIGAIVLYGVGQIFSIDRIGYVLDGKLGTLLHFKKSDVFKACEWFNKKGKYTVLFCRCVPVVRSLISIPAGISQMQFSSFIIMTILGALIWNTILVYLGAFAGASWSKIVVGSSVYTNATIIILGIALVVVFLLYFKRIIPKNKH